ncbi:MAG TPA: 3-hydroxyacyl-CoA dehydrogenase NAD-binding domain-containing protein, partial [Chitinophagaceae bacterium]|nr:3-hydroxyacyl-CoA dehydrogenase NAD-binding domain-containing protein [Chitinophagaceae bacterium]
MKIAVIGAGTMGNGIAHVFAQHGFPVSLIDISEAQLQKAIATITKNLGRQAEKGQISAEVQQQALNNIGTSTSFDALAGVSLVIEAATENT